jgi:Rod binding domain-containing protein
MDAPANAAAALALAAQHPVAAPAIGTTPADAKKAAEDFEAVFLTEMLGNMYEGLSTDGPFGGGQGENVMRTLLVDEYAKSMAARGGVGIADNVYRELIQIQEGAHAKPAGN